MIQNFDETAFRARVSALTSDTRLSEVERYEIGLALDALQLSRTHRAVVAMLMMNAGQYVEAWLTSEEKPDLGTELRKLLVKINQHYIDDRYVYDNEGEVVRG